MVRHDNLNGTNYNLFSQNANVEFVFLPRYFLCKHVLCVYRNFNADGISAYSTRVEKLPFMIVHAERMLGGLVQNCFSRRTDACAELVSVVGFYSVFDAVSY